MVRIRITKAEYPNETGYVGGIYEAFVMDYGCNVEYAAHVDKDKILAIKAENCEVIDEVVSQALEHKSTDVADKILMVEDGSVDIDALEEWCDGKGIYMLVYRQGAARPEFLNLK